MNQQLMVSATIVAVVTFVMAFTFTMVYISSGPNLGIKGLVKTALFAVFVLCNSVPILASVVVAVMNLMVVKLVREYNSLDRAVIYMLAISLLQFAFLFMLVSFVVGVCLVAVTLLP